HLKHVKKYKGCTRLLLDVDGKRLKVSGELLYSPTGLHKPRRDRALTVAGTFANATSRSTYFTPQSGPTCRRSSGMTVSAASMQRATTLGVSPPASSA